MICTSSLCHFLIRYYKFILPIFFLVCIIFSLNVFSMIHSYSQYNVKLIQKNIKFNKNIGIDEICEFINCSHAILKNISTDSTQFTVFKNFDSDFYFIFTL